MRLVPIALGLRTRIQRQQKNDKKKKGKKNTEGKNVQNSLLRISRGARTRLESFSTESLAPLACYTQGNGSNEITYQRCRGFSVCRRVP